MIDPVLWHALHRLADYPALASSAQGRTAATKLDGRACLHLYQDGLGVRLKDGRWWPPVVSTEQISDMPPAIARRRIP